MMSLLSSESLFAKIDFGKTPSSCNPTLTVWPNDSPVWVPPSEWNNPSGSHCERSAKNRGAES